MVVSNPIVRGFWPDPSVCRANGKFYYEKHGAGSCPTLFSCF